MTESTRDLWPADLGVISTVPPVAILREQAANLGRRTRGLLEGEIVSRPERHARGEHGYPFLHEFRVRAPAFGDYRYLLFDVRHGFALYPVSVRFKPTGEEYPANSEQELIDVLASLFSHPQTRRIIDALLSQIEAQ
jgi:hypothetical protein